MILDSSKVKSNWKYLFFDFDVSYEDVDDDVDIATA